MKVQYAPWEKRNLGITSYEIAIEAKDSFNIVRKEIEKIDSADYIVVKVPVNKKDFLWGMPEIGYTFIENQVLMRVDKANYVPIPDPKEFEGRLSVRNVTDEIGQKRIKDHIGTLLFDTDRVSLDKFFTKEDAAKRYQNWTQDVLEKGGTLHELYVDDTPAGFTLIPKNEGPEGHAGLSSLYKEFQGKHLGAIIFRSSIGCVLEKGAECCITGTSSNNYTSITTHLRAGYYICGMEYVYVKHFF